MKKRLWGILYGVILFACTVYVLLDTFVIVRVYETVPSGEESSVSQSQEPEDADSGAVEQNSAENLDTAKVSSDSYEDGNISIVITEYREHNTSIYVADVQLSSADYFQTALAQGVYGKNVTEKTSEIAQTNNAILAINGDYYGSQENGYVLRNGVLYRETASANQEDLVIWADGSFEIVCESEISASQLLDSGAEQILSFGPALVLEGLVSVTEEEEVGRAKASNPRTAIGWVDELRYLFVVSDGRTEESEGLTLYELAEFMQSLGAKTAYNLDGGGLSTMYFNGEVVNNPTSTGNSVKERSVSDIVYIGYG